MKLKSRLAMLGMLVLVTVMAGLSGNAAISADVKIDNNGNVPYYARLIHIDDQQSAAVFYRPPECTPDDFNLFFNDFPGVRFDFARAFSCAPPTTDGTAWFKGDEPVGIPRRVHLEGTGNTPIWVFDRDALVQEAADGVVTIQDLRALDPLVLSASSFEEKLVVGIPDHPEPPRIHISARGESESGQSFWLLIKQGLGPDNPIRDFGWLRMR